MRGIGRTTGFASDRWWRIRASPMGLRGGSVAVPSTQVVAEPFLASGALRATASGL